MAENENTFQLEWISRHAVSLDKKFEGFRETSPGRKTAPKRLKKLPPRTKRRITEESVDEELDLHGLTVDQGIAETEMFIDLAREYRLGAIRIVHGLGPDTGRSLRSEVQRFLKTRGKGKIKGFKIEPHNQGAVIVYPAAGRKAP
jgi:DNA-nicking Smr family endonuclease